MLWPVVVLLALSSSQEPRQQPTLPPGDVPRTFVVTYSDGRTISELLRSRGGSISPGFPRRRDAPTHEGLSLSGLQIDYFADRDVIEPLPLETRISIARRLLDRAGLAVEPADPAIARMDPRAIAGQRP